MHNREIAFTDLFAGIGGTRFGLEQACKHVLVIPDDAVKELGWNGDQDLEIRVENRRLIVEVKRQKKEESHK
jgi:site-specific DNA-cytosine methylase